MHEEQKVNNIYQGHVFNETKKDLHVISEDPEGEYDSMRPKASGKNSKFEKDVDEMVINRLPKDIKKIFGFK
jgi:hypothetical protein